MLRKSVKKREIFLLCLYDEKNPEITYLRYIGLDLTVRFDLCTLRIGNKVGIKMCAVYALQHDIRESLYVTATILSHVRYLNKWTSVMNYNSLKLANYTVVRQNTQYSS